VLAATTTLPQGGSSRSTGHHPVPGRERDPSCPRARTPSGAWWGHPPLADPRAPLLPPVVPSTQDELPATPAQAPSASLLSPSGSDSARAPRGERGESAPRPRPRGALPPEEAPESLPAGSPSIAAGATGIPAPPQGGGSEGGAGSSDILTEPVPEVTARFRAGAAALLGVARRDPDPPDDACRTKGRPGERGPLPPRPPLPLPDPVRAIPC